MKWDSRALGITIVYLLVGGLWVLLSDQLLLRLLGPGLVPGLELETGKRLDHEYRFRDKAGRVRWIRDSTRLVPALYDLQGSREVIGSWQDITHEHEEEERRRLTSTALRSLNEGVLILAEDLSILFANAAFERISGYGQDALLGQHPRMFRSGLHGADFFREARRELDSQGHWSGEVWNRHRAGRLIPLLVTGSRVSASGRTPARYVLVYQDISELQKEAELNRMAHFDSLTHLPNRRLLCSRLDLAIGKARAENRGFAVLHLNLDDFKTINDSVGHSLGNELLLRVARRFQENLESAATLSRVGGDEFAVLSEDTAGMQDAASLARRLLDSLRSPFTLTGRHEVFVECCIGISLYPDHGNTPERPLQSANAAMHRAKQLGRNQKCFFSDDIVQEVSVRLEILTALRRGVEQQELLLHYQPKVDAAGKIAGAEALLRWRRPEQGLVPPAQFVPLAEATGLITPIGALVIDEAAHQIRDWLDAGTAPPTVAVNVSARQFRDHNLEALVRSVLEKFDIPPHLLGLEITESALTEQPDDVKRILDGLKALGVSVSLDDFGTGFSSFSYLSRFPLDVLKIDLSFIQRIGVSPKDGMLVTTMIDIAHNLGMKVVAEGVEGRRQLDFLRERGCDQSQGSLFSPALPPEDFSPLLKAGKVTAHE